ncbi:hypothetical protein ABRT01_05980 [Lentibacillus sp. L22]|uniref:hypothetical protein n=1 Tax=Lentibacillus TaxID=175304 RepID=UPI0022B1A98C|nr:hypothetical protein [Lentibacillus daqui]
MLELLNQLTSDVSPFYVYLSIILTIICAYRGMSFTMGNTIQQNQIFTRQWHATRFRLLPAQEELGANTEIHHWIAAKMKRIEAPDDDSDSHSCSLKVLNDYHRGGQKWNANLYSQLLENIA